MQKFIFLIILLSSSILVLAEDDTDILKIHDEFVISNAVASRCIKPDKETMVSFLANFQMISIYVIQKLQKQFPDNTQEDILNALDRKAEVLTKKMNTIIAEKGCSDSDIQQFIKLFHAQAQWKPGK